MLELGPGSEADMVAAFLRAELDSPRWAADVSAGLARIGASRALIEQADPSNSAENRERVQVLAYRGYPERTALFAGFPTNVAWQRATLDATDLARVRVLNQPHWVTYSGPSRLAANAAGGVATGSEAGHVAAVAAILRDGGSVPEVIVVGTSLDDLVILEGHVRVMAALGGSPPPNLSAFVGVSPDMANWAFY